MLYSVFPRGRKEKRKWNIMKTKRNPRYFDLLYILKAEIYHLVNVNIPVVSCHMVLILSMECEKIK